MHYQHTEIGYNYRMSNICAGVGLGQMKNLDENVKLRRENHFFYKEIFKNIVGVELFEVLNEDYFSNYWLNIILIEATIFESRIKESLRLAFEEKNIETRSLETHAFTANF
ncbi:DegT/DnrJ/EryC1/StrS aminotransferase family protein [Flavobacterium sp. 270]|nr:DegT/DnrJ/EryC1/StrS aminotransferase family protein [Flavobacterium sp. 270]